MPIEVAALHNLVAVLKQSGLEFAVDEAIDHGIAAFPVRVDNGQCLMGAALVLENHIGGIAGKIVAPEALGDSIATDDP